MRVLLIGLAAIALSACTAADRAAVETAVAKKKQFNDSEAQLLLQGPCAMSVGAYFRIGPMDRRAVEALCGGEGMPRPSDTVLGQ